MNIQEAIEFINSIEWIYYENGTEIKNQVIELLKRGEKYEAIYKEAVKYFNSIDDNIIKELEQEYFPEEVNK